MTLRKAGIYHFDASPATLKVFSGEATVEFNGQTTSVGAGKTIAFEGQTAGVAAKFDKEETDALDRWSRRRGEMVAMANVSAAKSLRDSGYSLYSGSWYFNPFFGLMTYIPARGICMSPYGYSFWSPITVTRVYYQPPPNFGGGGFGSAMSGYTSMAPTSSGYSGVSSSMASSSSSAAVASSGATSAAASGASSVGHGAGGGGGGRQH